MSGIYGSLQGGGGGGTPSTAGQSPGTPLIIDSNGDAVWKNPEDYVLDEWEFLLDRDPWFSRSSGGGSASIIGTGTSVHPGILIVRASSTGETIIQSGLRNGSQVVGGGFIRWEAIVSVPTLSDPTNRYIILCGFGDQFNGAFPANGIYFHYDDTTNSGRWVGKTENASVETSVNSSVTVTAGQWYHLAIEINAAATSVEFFIDGTSIGTSTTNITANPFSLMFVTDETVGTAFCDLYIDWCKFYQELSTARIG